MKARERIVPRLMNQAEAAAYCRVSLPTFLNACPVPPVKIGTVSRFDRHRIDEWLDSLSRPTAPDWLAKMGLRTPVAQGDTEPASKRRRRAGIHLNRERSVPIPDTLRNVP